MSASVPPRRTPAYLQLYTSLREAIVSGLYPFGAKLPSKRTLADREGVSLVTVEHAYALLSEEGYVEPREKSGYFVLFRPQSGFSAVSERAVPLPVPHPTENGDTPDFPFSILAKTMRRVLSESGEGILERSPGAGCLPLREAIRDYLARSRGIAADASQIVIGAGSEHLYGLIVSLLGRGKTFAIETPSYKRIEQVYSAQSVSVVRLPLGHDGIEPAALWSCTADVLHISPYRSFPSGVTASASRRHDYLRWAREGARMIVEDDFESEFSVSRKPEETLFALSDRPNVIYLNTFSKTLSPSLRMGYMILPEALAERFSEKLDFISCPVPTFMQLVMAELIENGDFTRHINRVRRKKRG